MGRVNVRTFVCGSALGILVSTVLSLALTTGCVFLSFYIGWKVQLAKFTAEGNGLATGYATLFAIPAVSDAWSVFSCFLYGALILLAVAFGVGVVLFILTCCCGLPLLACLFSSGDGDDMEERSSQHRTPPARHYGSTSGPFSGIGYNKITVVT